MSAAITIYRQEYTHKGHAFSVWSYLDDPDPERSTLLFAYRAAGVTRVGLPDRKEALTHARRRLDALPDRPEEKTAVDQVPTVGWEQRQTGLAFA
jgi:hypothetical protein